MRKVKALLGKLGRGAVIVIHDPEVRTAGKVFAAKIAFRLALALGGSVFFAEKLAALFS